MTQQYPGQQWGPQPGTPPVPQRSLWKVKRLYAIGAAIMFVGFSCGVIGSEGARQASDVKADAINARPTPTVTKTIEATVTATPAPPKATATKTVTATVTATKTVTKEPADSYDDSSNGGDSGGGYVYYKNCDAARAAGAAPVRTGDPGYGRHLDRDGDGVGCE